METTFEQTSTRKNAKSRRDTAVQGTNDSSIISKLSMVSQGYFQDRFYEYFVNKQLRRAPLINRGYYIRVKTVDHIIKNFLLQFEGVKQIISIGAGFDTSYFRLKSDGCLVDTVFVEVDFPELVKRKHGLISYHEELSQLLSEKVKTSEKSPLLELNTKDYKLLGVDLTQLPILDAALRMCGIDFDLPTIILSECVLTYITRRCSTSVVSWGSETFCNSIFILYEQINPNDAFGLFMQNHFHVVGSPLKCINSYPTLESQKQRFLQQGWSWCEAYDMNQFYYKLINQDERDRIEKLEAFDEHEEWHVKCSHYMILLAYSSQNINSLMCQDFKLLDLSYPDICLNCAVPNQITVEAIDDIDNVSIKRYSHITGYLAHQYILVFGGFGEQDGRHQRLTEIALFNPTSNKLCATQLKIPDLDFPRMHLSATTLNDGRLVIIGGRNSPYKVSKGVISVMLKSQHIENVTDNLHTCDINSVNNMSRHSSTVHSAQSCHNVENTNSSVSEYSINSCETVSEDYNSCLVSLSNCDITSSTVIQSNCNKTEETWLATTEFCDLEFKVIKECGDIPEPRWRHAVCSIFIDDVEYVFLYGGRTMLNLTLNNSYLLNTQTGEWKKLNCGGDVAGDRQSHSLCVWKGKIVLYGGLDVQLLPVYDVHILDLDTLTWRKLKLSGTLYPRYSHTAHIIEDKMVIIGGVNLSHNTPGIAVVNLVDGTSTEYSLPIMDKNNLMLFHQHSTVLLANNKILVIGGGGNCFSFGTHLNKTPFIIDIQHCLQGPEV